jgi:hypothetical protein
MPDLERLHADAEEAQIFSEVARSQLLTAKASARERRIQWTKIHARRLTAVSSGRGSASIYAPEAGKDGAASPGR